MVLMTIMLSCMAIGLIMGMIALIIDFIFDTDARIIAGIGLIASCIGVTIFIVAMIIGMILGV